MNEDEQAIRQWAGRWYEATTQGDLPLAQTLFADDVVFLVAGVGRMDKASFLAAATATDPNTAFDLTYSIEEVRVVGDHAWLITNASLDMTDKQTNATTRMAGHGFTVLERQNTGWVGIRDVTTMVVVPKGE